ncbi:MAG: type II secretion system protein, partial [Phycisphaerae bacterium]
MSKRKAFTLIELLVVIAIIGLLVSILVPALANIQDIAKHAKCKANLKTIGTAVQTYKESNYRRTMTLGRADDFKAEAEAQSSLDNLWANQAECNIQSWWLLVADNVVEEKAFVCPSDQKALPLSKDGGNYGFQTWMNVSYGLQPAVQSEENPAFPGANGQPSDTVIVADKPDMKNDTKVHEWNVTPNHPKLGINMLSLVGTVST